MTEANLDQVLFMVHSELLSLDELEAVLSVCKLLFGLVKFMLQDHVSVSRVSTAGVERALMSHAQRGVLRDMLGSEGIALLAASRGEEALRVVR